MSAFYTSIYLVFHLFFYTVKRVMSKPLVALSFFVNCFKSRKIYSSAFGELRKFYVLITAHKCHHELFSLSHLGFVLQANYTC